MNETEAKTTENARQSDRDENGRFSAGNKAGVLWTPETAPRNAGRPKTKPITSQIEKWLGRKADALPMTKKLAEQLRLDPAEHTVAEIYALSMMYHSIKGKGDVIRETMKRIEGEVPRQMTLEVDDPVRVYLDDMRAATETEPKEPESLPAETGESNEEPKT